MGSRNFDLGARDMKAAGRIALEEGMQSFSSVDTMADRWNLFVDYVREYHGFGRMELITPDVVLAYGEILTDRVTEGDLEASTAQNYISAVNRVLELARGDQHMTVSPTRDCGIPMRENIAKFSQYVTIPEHNDWLGRVDPVMRILLRLQRAFGMRFEESAKFDARNAHTYSHKGPVPIVNGTKGGRPRQVPIWKSSQSETLSTAQKVQGSHHSLIPEGMSYEEFRRHCYRVATANGIRFHRERHSYACQRYMDLVGAECPVMATIPHGEAHIEWLANQLRKPLEVARERDRTVRAQIAQELGHNRIEVTNAYLG
jgi:hypothetical protein